MWDGKGIPVVCGLLVWAAFGWAQSTIKPTLRFRAIAHKVVVFEDRYYGGLKQAFDQDVANLKGTLIGNDRIRSLRVPPGFEVVLFEHIEFRGRQEVFREDDPDLSDNRIGLDEASSLKIRKVADQ
jgi:hypothetical protein